MPRRFPLSVKSTVAATSVVVHLDDVSSFPTLHRDVKPKAAHTRWMRVAMGNVCFVTAQAPLLPLWDMRNHRNTNTKTQKATM
jgi:hypothetical protein